jgi:prepilin-type N-terminal cleavage/methylation domain-containing protein
MMNVRFSRQPADFFPSRGRAGMTMVEVLVALVISVLLVAGIVHGYIYCTTSTTKAELAQAASAKAMQRLEEARSATWNTSSGLAQDQLVAANFTNKTVTLDMPGTGTVGTSATIMTTISQISLSPPLRKIHVDCVWQFQGTEWVTNSIETIRAADQ